MNKKLIAVAIAAVVAAPGAFAQATLYGKFHASIDNIDSDTANEDNWELNSRASRVGVKGSEDLGGGLKAIYQLELSVNVDGGGDGQGSPSSGLGGASRNTFVGLSGGWGTFLVGRHDTPAKIAFYAAGNDRLGDSAIDVNTQNSLTPGNPAPGQINPSANSPIGVFHEYRANDTITYISPSFSGFTFAGTIIPGEDNDVPNARDGIADHWSLGAMYKGGGLKASVGYTEYDGAGVDQEVLQAGASYTFNNFSVGGHYETTDNRAFNDGDDYDAWAITGKATFGNNAISLVYTDSELESPALGNNEVENGGWGLAAEHNLSKRTKVYAAYADGKVDREGNEPDEDNSIFSLGMIHNF